MVIQEAYEIPDDIATGLATGIYKRFGSVIRYASGPEKGRIVEHLLPVKLEESKQFKGLSTKALKFAQEHKKGIVVGTVCAGAICAGTWAYKKWKKHEPQVLVDYRVAFKTYIDAIRSGNMDVDKIDNLMKALENLKCHKNYKKIEIQLTAEDLHILVNQIYEYTIKLAKDNSVDLSDKELQLNNFAIINLGSYLKAQKRIFESVA